MAKRYDNECVLCIGCTHAPFHHPDSMEFLSMINRTYEPDRIVHLGDECYTEETEFLVKDKGWISCKDVSIEDEVCTYTHGGVLVFEKPSRVINKKYTGKLILRNNDRHRSLVTANHNMVLKKYKYLGEKIPASCNKYKHRDLITCGTYDSYTHDDKRLTINQLKLLVAVSADATIRKGGDIYFCLKKERKINRLISILDEENIRYSNKIDCRGYSSIFIHRGQELNYLSKVFDITLLSKMSLPEKVIFINELQYWDGYYDKDRNRIVYCSSNYHNISFVQAIAVTIGKYCSVRNVFSKYGKSYQACIYSKEPRIRYSMEPEEIDVKDIPVYCCTVSSGMLLVRNSGTVYVCGNCDNHSISFHAKNPDLFSPRDELIKARKFLKEMEKLFPKVDLVKSNHGSLVHRKVLDAGLPKGLIQSYNKIYGVGDGWKWHTDLNLTMSDRSKWYFCHGVSVNALGLSKSLSTNVVQAHYHNSFFIQSWMNTLNETRWACQVGTLIDDQSMAFNYNKANVFRPLLGVMLIEHGVPRLIPMQLNRRGRWNGTII